MATTQRSDLIYPTILQEEVIKGIAGVQVFNGSRAVVINPTLQGGADAFRNRRSVTVPYFNSIGKAQEIPEGAPSRRRSSPCRARRRPSSTSATP